MFGFPPEVENHPEFQRTLREELGNNLMASARQADALWLGGAREAAKGVRANQLGEQVMQLPTAAWAYYRFKEQADFGSREDRKIIERLHPQARVKATRETLSVGWTPESDAGPVKMSGKKFHKVYPQ